MKNDGFSLIELVVVIAIIATLSTIGTIAFHTWQTKAQMENQTRVLFANLNQARIDAMQHKQFRAVKLQTGGLSYTFQLYSSLGQGRLSPNTTGSTTQTVKLAITATGGAADNITQFDNGGFAVDMPTFQINPTGTSALVDCIVVSLGRTDMGKNINGTCTVK